MEALTAYSKYYGSYEKWCQIRKSYSLHWTNGNESLQVMQPFFNRDLNMDTMLQKVKAMVKVLPIHMGLVIRHAVLTGLRPSEAVESVRLLTCKDNTSTTTCMSSYYNADSQALEHFRFPDIFLRQTKKAYISYITLDNLQPIVNLSCKTPSYKAIRSALNRRGLDMDMSLSRKFFASHLHQSGIPDVVIDLLQGRTPPSVLG